MSKYLDDEFENDAVQYAMQNRKPTRAEEAAIERISAGPAAPAVSNEVRRLAALLGTVNRARPTAAARPKDARVERAQKILRDGL